MATIKLQPSGAVVLKDGKVACTCCAQRCCPYPAQALVDRLYTYQDLPDTVLGTGIFGDDNVVMSRLNPPQPSIASSGTSYYRGLSSDGFLVGIGLRDGLEWVGTEVANEDAEFGECLISRLLIADQFAYSYTVTGPPGGPVTVTRQSLCVWTGPDSCGNEVRLEFLSYAEDSDYPYWFIGWLEYFGPVGDCNALDSSSGVKDPYAQDGDGIDTPVGNYYENVGQPPIGSVS